jgi:hypothetical protein
MSRPVDKLPYKNIVPVEDNHTLQFTTISNDNARDARNYELEKPLAPLFENTEIINNNSITKSGTLWLCNNFEQRKITKWQPCDIFPHISAL